VELSDIVGLILVVLGLGALQGTATLRVWRTDLYAREQKVAQTRLIWFIPLVGAVLVLMILRESKHEWRP
jgi:uncharacterized membrane protein YeaQ/YmgE (transglycosylase-associated protein family)